MPTQTRAFVLARTQLSGWRYAFGRYRVWSLTWDDVQEQFRNPVPDLSLSCCLLERNSAPLLSTIDPANAADGKRLEDCRPLGSLMLLLGPGEASWAGYAYAFVISLLEIDPDDPGRLRLRRERASL